MRPFSDIDLHAFVDNQVSGERREAIAAYLKAAPADAARVESWRRQNDAIRAVFSGPATEPVPVWLTVGQIASGRDQPVPLEKRSQGQPPIVLRQPRRGHRRFDAGAKAFGIAVLAFALGLALPVAFPRLQTLLEWRSTAAVTTETRETFVKRVLDAHATFGLDPDRPAEVVDNPEGILGRWLSRHAAFPVQIPRLVELGWTLRGGRVAPADAGRGALLVYEDTAGDRLSLYMARMGGSPVPGTFAIDPPGVLVWSETTISYGVATSKPVQWLSDHAAELHAAIHASGG